jgi:hypothetical protein
MTPGQAIASDIVLWVDPRGGIGKKQEDVFSSVTLCDAAATLALTAGMADNTLPRGCG